ncbi:MAG: hypothetical protein QGG26_13940 [Candidatus Undinarchaeales archaeon]|jgi:hypothetical protein|nr:hypothetical protein [Candidatus Undinarchaeales archaeon]
MGCPGIGHDRRGDGPHPIGRRDVWDRSYLIVVSLILMSAVLSGCTFQRAAEPEEDVTGEPFDDFYTHSVEKVCCGHCLEYGLYDSSSDCLDILQENEGSKQCIFILTDHPHTHFQCALVLQDPTPTPE